MKTMQGTDFSGVCRVCCKPIKPRTKHVKGTKEIKQQIQTIFPKIKTVVNNKFLVCVSCEWQVQTFYKFFTEIMSAHEKYNLLFESPADFSKPTEPKDNHNSDFDGDFRIKTETLIPKVEIEELKPKRSRSPPISAGLAKRIKASEKTVSAREVKDKANHLRHDKLIKDVFGLNCFTCSDGSNFETLTEYAAHMKTFHGDEKSSIKCCGIEFLVSGKRMLILDHARIHANPLVFQCKMCPKVCQNRAQLLHHEKIHDPAKFSQFTCLECGRVCVSQSSFELHKISHLPKEEREKHNKFFCDTCGKGFVYNSFLQSHMKTKHTNETKMVCEICAKIYRDKQCLATHMKRVHDRVKYETVKCEVCGRNLSKGSLSKHMRVVHGDNKDDLVFSCTICGKTTDSASSLARHKSRSHSTKKFTCEFCDKTEVSKIRMLEHMASHTGQALYTCDFCEKTFNCKTNKFSHQKKMHPVEYQRTKEKKIAALYA